MNRSIARAQHQQSTHSIETVGQIGRSMWQICCDTLTPFAVCSLSLYYDSISATGKHPLRFQLKRAPLPTNMRSSTLVHRLVGAIINLCPVDFCLATEKKI